MEITITDGWSFEIDENQYILVHTFMHEKQDFKTRKGTGEMVEKREEVGYFKTVTAMLRRLAEILVREKIAEGRYRLLGIILASWNVLRGNCTKCARGIEIR